MLRPVPFCGGDFVAQNRSRGRFKRVRSERFADFPVEAEGVDEAAYAPAVAFADGEDLLRAGGDGFGECGVGIGDGEDQAEILSAEWRMGGGRRSVGVRL